MDIVLLIGLCIFGLFAFVVFFGAPYVPTLNKQIDALFEVVDMNPGEVFLELGSGDGRVLAAAASRGIHAVGYELNPLLVLYSRIRWWKYRSLITVHWGNYWRKEWPQADVVYVFLLERYMHRLYERLSKDMERSCMLVSFAFQVPGVKPVRHDQGLYVYRITKH